MTPTHTGRGARHVPALLAALLLALPAVSLAQTFSGTTSSTGSHIAVFNDDSPFLTYTARSGAWYRVGVTDARRAFEKDYRVSSGIDRGSATWNLPVNPGPYLVSFRWLAQSSPYNSAMPTALRVRVYAGSTLLHATTVNQQRAPASLTTNDGLTWHHLGPVFNITGNSLRVEIAIEGDQAGKNVYVDALRLERADGSAYVLPEVSRLSHSTTFPVGGVPVSIHGARFLSGAEVFFGSRKSSSVSFVNSGELRAVVPAGTAGTTVDVRVVNPGGLGATLPGALRYSNTVALDNSDGSFARTGTWYATSTTVAGRMCLNNGLQGMNSEAGTARWSMSVPAGTYRVSASWQYVSSSFNASYTKSAPYEIFVGSTLVGSRTVNQQLAPSSLTDLGLRWQDIQTVTLSSPGVLTVQLVKGRVSDGKVTFSDAVRVQRLP